MCVSELCLSIGIQIAGSVSQSHHGLTLSFAACQLWIVGLPLKQICHQLSRGL
jgi:hypothetical protein